MTSVTTPLKYLLWKYRQRAATNSLSFHSAARYFARIDKTVQIFNIFIGTLLAAYVTMIGSPVNNESIPDIWMTIGTCMTTIGSAFLIMFKPAIKSQQCLHVSQAFREMSLSVEQFVREDVKSRIDYTLFSSVMLERITTTEANAPDIASRFEREAERMNILNRDQDKEDFNMFLRNAQEERRLTRIKLDDHCVADDDVEIVMENLSPSRKMDEESYSISPQSRELIRNQLSLVTLVN
jgi:hypothetical protein